MLLSTFAQIGRIVEGAADFYSARLPKKMRKETISEEIYSTDRIREYSERKFKV